MGSKIVYEWTSYFEKLLTLEQERFELEILLFFEDCNYDWHEIDRRIENLPPEVKAKVIERVERMRENTIAAMTKNLHTIFMWSTMIIAVMSLAIVFAFGSAYGIHFAAIGMMGLLALVILGSLWIWKN